MCLTKGHIAIHKDVQLDGVVVANPAGMKVVRLSHTWDRSGQLQNLVLYLIGQGMLHQVANTIAQQKDGHLNDKQAHKDGCYGIQDRPPLSQEDGTANTHGCTDGRERIAPMMPRIGFYGRWPP